MGRATNYAWRFVGPCIKHAGRFCGALRRPPKILWGAPLIMRGVLLERAIVMRAVFCGALQRAPEILWGAPLIMRGVLLERALNVAIIFVGRGTEHAKAKIVGRFIQGWGSVGACPCNRGWVRYHTRCLLQVA